MKFIPLNRFFADPRPPGLEPQPVACPDTMPRERPEIETQPMEVLVPQKDTSAAMKGLLNRLRNSSELLQLHLKHYHMSPAQFRHRTTCLRLSEDVHDRYKEVVQGCEHCVKKEPPCNGARLPAYGLTFVCDIIFIDRADVKI